MSFVITTTMGEGRVDIKDFARIALPDSTLEEDVICNAVGAGDGCHSFDSMQATARIPIAEFCEQGTVLEDALKIGVEFSASSADHSFIIDDLEFRRVPGEPDVVCRCN